MKEAVYEKPAGTNPGFALEYNGEGQLVSLQHPKDKDGMNWVKGNEPWGKVKSGLELSLGVSREFTERDTLLETYTFRNETPFDIWSLGTSLGIYVPFPDFYADAHTCMTGCCNTHLWCGGNSSYICALRMGCLLYTSPSPRD
mgnify:FL=1